MRIGVLLFLLVIFLGLTVAAFFLELANLSVIPGTEIAILGMMIIIASVGLLILSRRASNPIGWTLTLTALSLIFYGFAKQYGIYTLFTYPGSLPFGHFFAWLTSWLWVLFTGPIILFLPLLYPTGIFLSRRWKIIAWLNGIYLVGTAFLSAFKPGPLSNFETIDNPYGLGNGLTNTETLQNLSTFLVAPLFVISMICLFIRFYRSVGEKRAQLKWFFYIISLFVPYIIYGTLSDLGVFPLVPGNVSTYIFSAYLSLFAITIGIAILKYHLYDIDLIIRRTLQYGLLTVLLGVTYFAMVVLLGQAFQGVTEQTSPLALVISTLVGAALFNPLRKRIQQGIDRHFFRQRYDDERTLEIFALAARHETDLERLAGSLVQSVQQSIQPESIALWLRPGEHRRLD